MGDSEAIPARKRQFSIAALPIDPKMKASMRNKLKFASSPPATGVSRNPTTALQTAHSQSPRGHDSEKLATTAVTARRKSSGHAADSSYYTGIPSTSEAKKLKNEYDFKIKEAAVVLNKAHILLVVTGAGWGAESGLKTFAEVGEMYRRNGLDYNALCRPKWIESNKECDHDLFYGFWGNAFNSYQNTLPHRGYELVLQQLRMDFVDTEIHDLMRRSVANFLNHARLTNPTPADLAGHNEDKEEVSGNRLCKTARGLGNPEEAKKKPEKPEKRNLPELPDGDKTDKTDIPAIPGEGCAVANLPRSSIKMRTAPFKLSDSPRDDSPESPTSDTLEIKHEVPKRDPAEDALLAARHNSLAHTPPRTPSGSEMLRRKHRSKTEPAKKQNRLPLGLAPGAFFCLTSNIDSQWKAAGTLEHELREAHGNLTEWQCTNLCEGEQCQRVQLKKHVRFNVDDDFRARKSTKKNSSAHNLFSLGDVNRPVCAQCGGPMRPAVLMFADTKWVDDADQEKRYQVWRKTVIRVVRRYPWVRVAIMEIGCGQNVSTMRHEGLTLLAEVPQSTLIRINPDAPLAQGNNEEIREKIIPIMMTGLKAVDDICQKMRY